MKAVVLKEFGNTDNFHLASVPNPRVQEGEVLVRIMATAFNPIDYQMRRGGTESKLLKSHILGRELSGIIEEVGGHVSDFSIGDSVAAYVGSLASNGTYAEYISIPQQLIAKIPKKLSFAEAAALPMTGMTALQCIERLNIKKDDRVFISGGAGGVGSILIKLLLSNNFYNLITTAGSEESKDQLLALGLSGDNIFDYRQSDLLEQINQSVGNRPFDCCIDLVGGKMSEVCSSLIKVHGCIADVTYMMTGQAKEQLFDKAATIINVANYAYTLTGNVADTAKYGEMLQTLLQKVDENIITPPAVHVVGELDVESVKLAHQLLENNQTRGKKLVMLNG